MWCLIRVKEITHIADSYKFLLPPLTTVWGFISHRQRIGGFGWIQSVNHQHHVSSSRFILWQPPHCLPFLLESFHPTQQGVGSRWVVWWGRQLCSFCATMTEERAFHIYQQRCQDCHMADLKHCRCEILFRHKIWSECLPLHNNWGYSGHLLQTGESLSYCPLFSFFLQTSARAMPQALCVNEWQELLSASRVYPQETIAPSKMRNTYLKT